MYAIATRIPRPGLAFAAAATYDRWNGVGPRAQLRTDHADHRTGCPLGIALSVLGLAADPLATPSSVAEALVGVASEEYAAVADEAGEFITDWDAWRVPDLREAFGLDEPAAEGVA